MSGSFFDHLNPILGPGSVEPPDQRNPRNRPVSPGAQPQSIAGRVVSVQRGARHAAAGNILDLTVGGGEYTDILVRVPTGTYGQIEGKRVVLYIDE